MRIFVTAALLAFIGVSSATVIGFGSCPDVRLVEDFDIENYYGRWYEIARYYSIFEDGLSCITSDYVPMDDGTFKVVNTYRTPDMQEVTFEGMGYAPDPNQAARMLVQIFSCKLFHL